MKRLLALKTRYQPILYIRTSFAKKMTRNTNSSSKIFKNYKASFKKGSSRSARLSSKQKRRTERWRNKLRVSKQNIMRQNAAGKISRRSSKSN